MSDNTTQPLINLDQQSRWRIFCRHPLLLKIAVWLGSLSSIGSAGAAWADFQPMYGFSTAAPEIVPAATFSATDLDRRQSPLKITPNSPLPQIRPNRPNQKLPVAVRTISRPPHTDLLTADNYTVSVNRSAAPSKIPRESIEIPVPAPRSTTIPDRSSVVVSMTKSQIQPSYIKSQSAIDRSSPPTSIQSQADLERYLLIPETDRFPVTTAPPPQIDRQPRASLPTAISPQHKPLAGLKSNLVTPMQPRLRVGTSTAKSPETSETRSTIERLTLDPVRSNRVDDKSFELVDPRSCTQQHEVSPVKQLLQSMRMKPVPTGSAIPRLAFSQSKPIAFADTDTTEQMLDKSIDEITTTQNFENLSTSLDQKFTAKQPSSPGNSQPNPEQPKQKISLAKNTHVTVGVLALEANDFTDTINPLFDAKENSMISRFGSRSGIYYLVAGSGAGIRHQFSPNLEGSVGLLFRSSADTSPNTKSGGAASNNKLNNNKSPDRSNSDSGEVGGSLSSSYGTIAQLTYAPSQNAKFGITYVHGYNVNPEIGSENANKTDGINSAFGLQTFLRLDPNLALGGWVGFNQNSNVELNKNIFTWAITAGIPDLGGKGNLAGIVVGQEPRVIAASNLSAQDTGSAWHLEGFYQIKISNDLSITPAIIYLTGPNIDNVQSDAGSIIGAIGITFKF